MMRSSFAIEFLFLSTGKGAPKDAPQGHCASCQGHAEAYVHVTPHQQRCLQGAAHVQQTQTRYVKSEAVLRCMY